MRRLIVLLLTASLLGGTAVPATVLAGSSPVAETAAKKKSKKKKAKKKAKKCKKGYKVKGKGKKRRCVKIRPGRPGTPKPPALPSIAPIDYTALTTLSAATDAAVEKVTAMLDMADGAQVYLEVTKPRGATNLPVILEASGYHGTLYDRTGSRILPVPTKSGRPVGLTGFFPQRGYAVVMMDLRGTGRSQGCLDHLGPNDQSDLKSVIEWAATQPWSNGRVGMVGHSYVGSTPQIAIKLNPKGLVTVVPSAGLASIYDHQFQSGVAWNAQLIGPLIAYSQLATDADLPPIGPDPQGGETGDNFGQDRPQDTGCQYTQTALNAGPANYTGQETDWHRARDARKEATAWPGHVFLVHGVNDQAARIASAQWFHERGGRAGDKTWIGQWDHGIGCCPNQRGLQWTYALLAWFDRQLKQKNVDTGPPVEVFLNDAESVGTAIAKRQDIYTARAWPPVHHDVTFTTQGTGGMTMGAPAGGDTVTFTGDPQGYNSGFDATGGVEFVSEALAGDLLIAGVPTLKLKSATTLPRTDLIVNLIDVFPSGKRRRIGHCAMNPLTRQGIANLAPVIPGELMDLQPPCWAMGHRLRAGHQLALRVTASDPDHIPLGGIDPQVSVASGAGATAVTLPIVDGGEMHTDRFPIGPRPSGAGVGA